MTHIAEERRLIEKLEQDNKEKQAEELRQSIAESLGVPFGNLKPPPFTFVDERPVAEKKW